MASQEEDNKLECLSNVNKDQESYFLEVYKKHESILNNKNEPFENKIESLIDIWKTVGELNLSEFDLRHVIQIMDWAKLHALNIVLTAEWNGFKETHQSKLIDEIEKAQNELFKLNDGFATRCKKLADVVKNPWEDPVLMKLMKTKDIEVGPEEIEFFCVETAYLVSVRLKKLCESHCEDLALNLVTAFMNCKKQSKEQNFNLNLSETQMWFIFDIYIALLYKFQEKQKIVVLLKELSFEEGLQLIKRFVKKRVKIAKIWKNCQRVAVLALQMYISQTVVKYTEDLKDILRNYLEIYLTLCNTDSLLQDFTTSIRRISNLADASGLYLFCDVIQKMAGSKLKPFVIEMYIRALTTDMNELERQKDAKEDAKAEATTSRLAAAFCSLADFLSEHINVARECVLTAFSLEPTKERLNSIEEFARKSGHKVLDTGQEWKCKLHPPVLPSDEITWICSECGDWMCKPQLNLPKINMTLNEALQTSVLGISEALCDDLVVCLSNPRYQILSWFLPWDDLHRLCIMYLQDPQTTKNFVTELKFVDIDYSIFKGIKKEPVDELAGIERGYEQYLDHDFVSGEESSSDSEDSMSQDSRPYSLGSDGAGESFYIPLLPVQQKSDPNTLKSLRMFRPNLKRKDKDPEERIPEKIAKQEPSSTITSNSYRGIPESNSLSHFLNGTGQNMLPPQQDPDSKNVKTATLPLLGGQVAKNEVKSIQVHLQNLNTQKLLENSKVPTDQALKPYNQSTINSISGILKKELTIRLLNKPLLSGSKENNSHNISSSNSKTQISSQYQDIKTYSRIPQKTIKETKLQPTAIEPTAENKQLQEGITPHKAQPEQIPVLQVPVALEQPLLVPQANAETVVTQQKQQTMPLTLSCCQRTQLVDIKYQKRCWKSQPTIPPSQCKSSNQESNQKLPQSLSSDLKRPTIGEANNLDLECSTNQIPKTLNNSKTTLKLEEQLEVVDLTKESLQNLNHSPNLMAKQRIQAVVDLTLPSVAVTDSNRKQQTNIPIVDLTHPNLDPERSPSCNELLVPNSKQATSNPPNQVQNQCTLKNKLPETNSSQIDQQAIPQSPAKKAKTIDKAVNTCRQLYQIQKQYIERLQKPLRAQKLQEQAQISLPKQHSVSLPLKDQEKQSMTCSPTLAQQQQTIKVDLQSSTCFPKSDQIQSQVIIENPLTAGTQLPLQMQISTTSNQNPAKAMADSQANCTQDQVKSQNAIPVTQTKKPTLVQEQKEVKNLEKPSTNCSLNSLTLTTPQVLQNSFQNLDQSKIMNEQEIRPPTSPKRQLQNQINPAKTPATLKVILSKGKLPLSINSKSTSPLSSHQSQTFIHSTSPTQSQSHKDEIQNCPLQLPLEPRKQLEEQKGPQARNQAVNQDKYQSCHSLQKSYKSVQQELHQSKSPPYCQTQPNLELHIPVFSIPKNQSADLDQPPNRKQFLNEHPKQEKSMDKMADRSNRQQAQLKAGLIKLPSLRKSITRGCKSETLTTDSSNQPTKLGRHKNTLANRKQLQNGSCSSLKVPNLFPNSERQPLPRSQLKEPNITVPLPAQCSPNEISQLQRHLERPPLLVPVRSNKIPIELQEAQQIAAMLPNRSSQLSELKILKENEPNQTSNQLFRGDLLRNSCSSLETANKMDIEGANANDTSSNSDDNVDIEKNLAEMFGDEVKLWQKCTDINDNGLFSDAVGFEEDQMLLNNNNYSNIVKDIEVKDVFEDLPKNSNLTENIRTYAKKIRMKKDCVKKLLKGEIFNMSKNVNSTCNILPHSNVQNIQGKDKELKVVLCRLLTSKSLEGKLTICKEEYCTKQKCDRGKVPPRHSKRRKSIEKSENKVSKMSVTGQNYSISPLQDINPRVSPKVHLNSCCDLKSNSLAEDKKSINGKGCSEKNYARSVLANVPGLNDFQMIRPSNVNQIVNVVQVSGGRVTQNVPIQNTQTSTQVTPHIQRIGQPRIPETKTEPSTTTSTTTMVSAALTTTTKTTTTSQPSTLINILSQQVIRPVTTQANVVKRTPMINILSQQIIRPVQTPKTTTNTVTVSENNQTKPATTTAEQTLINPGSNLAKTTGAVKTVNTVTPGHGGTILQFICKSSLPKFQQAFGKTVYQNNTETVDSTTSTVDTGSTTTEPKKATVAKAVPVNVQPIQGSVIYSRQVPVGQTISLIPPGGTRQVFRIATTNPEQLLVKDSVIHSKMSALLAAALQGRAKTAEGGEVQINCDEATKVTLTRPTLVQNARIVKPVQLQLPTNVVRSTPQANLSSTTLEQLREFDMVYKQIKERSSTSTPAENANCGAETQEVTPQRISVTYVNQLPKYTQLSPVVVVTSYSSLQPAASPALSVTSQGSSSPCVTPSSTPTLPKITTKAIKGKTLKTTPPAPTNNTVTATTAAAKASPSIPKPQQKPQEDEHTTQRIFDILAEYAEQLRNSPDLNNKPAPRRRSNPPTNPSQNSKRKKSSSSAKKSGQSSSSNIDMDADDLTVGSEDSSGGNIIQLSVTDDEQSQAATITTPESNENSSSSSRQLILTETTTIGAQPRNLIIADSSVGEALKMSNAVIVPGNYIMPVSMVKGGQQIAVVSGGSKILATVPARTGQNMLLLQSFTNQNRKGGISTVKYSALQPISGISSQTLAGVSAQPPVILPPNSVTTAVALGQPLTLKKIGDDKETSELVFTISPAKEPPKLVSDVPQPDSSTNIAADSSDIKVEQLKLEPVKTESNVKIEHNLQPANSNDKLFHKYQKTVINSVGTSVIATTLKQDDSAAQTINVSLPSDGIKAYVIGKGNKGATSYRQRNYLTSPSWTLGIFLN